LDAHSQALITRTNAKSHPEGGHLQYYRKTWLREHTTHDVANSLNEIKSVKQNGKGELIISQS